MADVLEQPAEALARAFHETYERLAPEHGWATQTRSRKTWDEVPAENKSLMIATARDLITRGVVGVPGVDA